MVRVWGFLGWVLNSIARPAVEAAETTKRRLRGHRWSQVAEDTQWAVEVAGAYDPDGLASGRERWRQ